MHVHFVVDFTVPYNEAILIAVLQGALVGAITMVIITAILSIFGAAGASLPDIGSGQSYPEVFLDSAKWYVPIGAVIGGVVGGFGLPLWLAIVGAIAFMILMPVVVRLAMSLWAKRKRAR